MKLNIIVNYVVCVITGSAAALSTLPYGWAHVSAIALSTFVGVATATSGTILSVQAVRNKSNA